MNKKTYAELIRRTSMSEFTERVIASLEKADDKILRFIDIVYDIDVKVDELKPATLKYDNVVCHLTAIDYLNDRVDYVYESTDIRYFKTEEEAYAYAERGEYRYSNSNSEQNETYPYKGVYVHNVTSWCNVDDWQSRNTPVVVENV